MAFISCCAMTFDFKTPHMERYSLFLLNHLITAPKVSAFHLSDWTFGRLPMHQSVNLS